MKLFGIRLFYILIFLLLKSVISIKNKNNIKIVNELNHQRQFNVSGMKNLQNVKFNTTYNMIDLKNNESIWDTESLLNLIYEITETSDWKNFLHQINFEQNNFKFKLILSQKANSTEMIFSKMDSKYNIDELDIPFRKYTFKNNLETLNKLSNELDFSFLKFYIQKFIDEILLVKSSDNKEKYKFQLQILKETKNISTYIIVISDIEFNSSFQRDNKTNETATASKFSRSADTFSGQKMKDIFSLYRFKSLESQNKTNSKTFPISSNSRIVENPCYLKGYFNKTKNMTGTGDFKKCYDVLAGMITKGQSMAQEAKKSQKENSIILGKDFKELSDFFQIPSISFRDLRNETESICKTTFERLRAIYYNNLNPNICMKLVYTVVLIEKLFGYNEDAGLTLILPIDSSTLELEKQNYLLNKNKLEHLKLPSALVLIFVFLFIIFLSTYYMRKEYSHFIQRKILTGSDLDFSENTHDIIWKSKLVEETFKTLMVKNFILHDEKLSLEVDRFTRQTIYYSYQEYRKFVFEMIPQSKGLREKIIQTLVQRDEFKASIVISAFLIILNISLLILTIKMIPYLVDGRQALNYMALVSFGYMAVLIFESLILISYIEKKKYLYAGNLTNNEKRILEEQFDNSESSTGFEI